MRAGKIVVTLLVVVMGLMAPSAASAQKASGVLLDRPVERASAVVFTGRTKARAKVRLQVRAPKWRTIRTTRASASGRYRVSIPRSGAVRSYRVATAGRTSRVRTVSPTTSATSTSTATGVKAPSDACGTRPRKADGTYWACTFTDEFSGSALDRSKWLVQQSLFSGMYGGSNSCYLDDPASVVVGGGVVKLVQRRGLAPFTCRTPYASFTSTATSSTIGSYARFNQTYGRFSARIKMPAESMQPGSHSAFWLYPQDLTYGNWPNSGEIDIAEWFSFNSGNVYPSVHYAGENVALSSGYTCAMPTSSTSFHTYTVDWTPTVMRFYYDDKLCFTHAWTPTNVSAPAPFDKPFYLVLTQMWGLGANTAGPSFPTTSTLTVDWVRVWK